MEGQCTKLLLMRQLYMVLAALLWKIKFWRYRIWLFRYNGNSGVIHWILYFRLTAEYISLSYIMLILGYRLPLQDLLYLLRRGRGTFPIYVCKPNLPGYYLQVDKFTCYWLHGILQFHGLTAPRLVSLPPFLIVLYLFGHHWNFPWLILSLATRLQWLFGLISAPFTKWFASVLMLGHLMMTFLIIFSEAGFPSFRFLGFGSTSYLCHHSLVAAWLMGYYYYYYCKG
jgi:hypothetical protein